MRKSIFDFRFTIYGLLVLFSFFVGCDKNPVERLANPVPNGAVPQSSGIYVLYDDELNTGGGAAFIPGGESQFLSFVDTNEIRRTTRQIRYTWDGQPVGGQQLFAGFQLILTPDGSTLSAATPKNLSAPGYTKLTFWVRGQLSSGNTLRVEGPSDGVITAARAEIAASSLSNSNWIPIELLVPAGDFSSVRIFVTFSIQFTQPPRTTNPGEGGTIFIDDIKYE